MTNTQPLRTCPICGEDFVQSASDLQSGVFIRYDCKRCGKYDLDEALPITGPVFERVRHLVSAWVRRNQSPGRPPVVGKGMDLRGQDWLLRFEHMGFPMTPDEKMDALLLAYGETAGDGYKHWLSLKEHPSLIAEAAAKSMDQVVSLNTLLRELGYLETTGERVSVRAQGWQRISELRKRTQISDTAFVAMWFDEDCTAAYREAAKSAIERSGYRPVIVDDEKYNGFVMDKIVSLVRESRFIIADFTCRPEQLDTTPVSRGIRGGVYWEAGMAYGLGKPVIHTCEDSDEAKQRLHFDVRQYVTIFWKPDELGLAHAHPEEEKNPNFADRLALHIRATVGKGSYVAEKQQGE